VETLLAALLSGALQADEIAPAPNGCSPPCGTVS
jgi:hypothetical protein